MLAVIALGGGCAAGGLPSIPRASSSPTPSVAPTSIPADGFPLSSFGFANGPVGTFSLPRTTILRTAVDQPNNVTAILGQPSTSEVYAYLQRTLPGAGFTITASDAGASTLTFAGRGWTGSFTGDAGTCAVLLRPS